MRYLNFVGCPTRLFNAGNCRRETWHCVASWLRVFCSVVVVAVVVVMVAVVVAHVHVVFLWC